MNFPQFVLDINQTDMQIVKVDGYSIILLA